MTEECVPASKMALVKVNVIVNVVSQFPSPSSPSAPLQEERGKG